MDPRYRNRRSGGAPKKHAAARAESLQRPASAADRLFGLHGATVDILDLIGATEKASNLDKNIPHTGSTTQPSESPAQIKPLSTVEPVTATAMNTLQSYTCPDNPSPDGYYCCEEDHATYPHRTHHDNHSLRLCHRYPEPITLDVRVRNRTAAAARRLVKRVVSMQFPHIHLSVKSTISDVNEMAKVIAPSVPQTRRIVERINRTILSR